MFNVDYILPNVHVKFSVYESDKIDTVKLYMHVLVVLFCS